MPVPTNLSDLSTTAASNSPASTDTLSTTDDYLRALSAILAKVGDGTNALVSPTFTTSVVTGSTTFSVFNATATTIDAFGAATTLRIGNAAGATALKGTLDVAGNFSVATSKFKVYTSGAVEFAGAVSGITTLATSSYIKTGTATATGLTAGDIGLQNATYLKAANAANSVQLGLIGLDASNVIQINSDGLSGGVNVSSAGPLTAGAISGTTGTFNRSGTGQTIAALASDLASGGYVYSLLGKAVTTDQAAYTTYSYNSTLASQSIGIGFWGGSDVLNIKPAGLSVTGTLTSSKNFVTYTGLGNKTVTVTFSEAQSAVYFIMVAAHSSGAGNHSRACWLVGGRLSDAQGGITAIVGPTNAGNVTIGAMTLNNGTVTFAVTCGQNFTVTVTGSSNTPGDVTITSA